MRRKWVKYHLIFFLLSLMFNYVFNFFPLIPDGKLFPYTLFFVVDFAALIMYFYLVMFLSQYILRRIAFFIPVQLMVMLLSCAVLCLIPYCFFSINGYKYSFSHTYFLKMFEVAYFTFGSFGFLFLQKWDESSNQKIQLIESLTDAELKFLASQMSPHFLLNALNTIYSLALTKSPEVYTAISELNVIYSYVQKNEGRVSLKDEISHLQNFIKIQQRRFKNNVELKERFSMDKDYYIEPLLLSSFVENAFKHGIKMKEHSSIHIDLQVYNGKLEYVVSNTDHSDISKDSTSGIGLQNLSRRLELLYRGNYRLHYYKGTNTFTASLTIVDL